MFNKYKFNCLYPCKRAIQKLVYFTCVFVLCISCYLLTSTDDMSSENRIN